jgi:hypothetical protein
VAVVVGRRSRRGFEFREPFAAALAAAATAILLGLVAQRAVVLLGSERVPGRVVEVIAANERCRFKWLLRPCTRYTARVTFHRNDGRTDELIAEAGRVRRHGQPLARSWYDVGDVVPVAYDAERLARAWVNDASGLWKAPFLAAIGTAALWAISLFGRW